MPKISILKTARLMLVRSKNKTKESKENIYVYIVHV